MLVTLSKIREVHFSLLGRNGFHMKAENERFTAALFSKPQKRKFHFVIWLRQKVAQKGVPYRSTTIFPRSTNQVFIVGVDCKSVETYKYVNHLCSLLAGKWFEPMIFLFLVESRLLVIIVSRHLIPGSISNDNATNTEYAATMCL